MISLIIYPYLFSDDDDDEDAIRRPHEVSSSHWKKLAVYWKKLPVLVYSCWCNIILIWIRLMIENTVVLSMNAPFDFYFVSVFCFCQLYSMLIGLIKWSCTVQASELPVRASQLIAFDAGHAGLSFLPQSPRMICHPRVILCGRPQTHKNMLAASSVGLRRAATRPACNLTNDHSTICWMAGPPCETVRFAILRWFGSLRIRQHWIGTRTEPHAEVKDWPTGYNDIAGWVLRRPAMPRTCFWANVKRRII